MNIPEEIQKKITKHVESVTGAKRIIKTTVSVGVEEQTEEGRPGRHTIYHEEVSTVYV